MKKDQWLPVLSGMIVSIVFGLSFMVTRGALSSLKPLQLIGFRFILAALILTVLRYTGLIHVNLRKKNLQPLFLLAFFQPVLYFLFETMGIQWTSASEAGMMIGLIPVVTVLLEIPFFKTFPSWKQFLSILLSVSGIFFIFFMQGNIEITGNIRGILCLFGAILSGSLYNIFSKKSSSSFSPLEITYFMMWVGALIFNILSLGQSIADKTLSEYLAPLAQPEVWVAISYLGILSSVLAFFLLNYMLSKTQPSQTATYVNLTTVIAILGGVLFRGEAFAWYQAVGA
ncbi:MAG: DMT family transporter, partial [Candidatus Aminicenantes bacterium]|nr:DMT family transporter [Candidatus Aminicenantes bacterium]